MVTLKVTFGRPGQYQSSVNLLYYSFDQALKACEVTWNKDHLSHLHSIEFVNGDFAEKLIAGNLVPAPIEGWK